ncbi:MAG: ribokinase [Clostridia bacterium]|nr:ribokinase [Clostridia bacterium]
MSKVLCFGSLNIDYTYSVQDFVRRGETISSSKLDVFAGGKGLNQCTALARAGAETYMAGRIGEEGIFLTDALKSYGADVSKVAVSNDVKTGHAIIQNNAEGDNCIILFGGANRIIDEAYVDAVLADFSNGDYIVLQNEISCMAYIMEKAHEKGMKIVLNPSPIDDALFTYPLELADILMMNEIEASALLGDDFDIENPLPYAEILAQKYNSGIVVTLGSKGACYSDGKESFMQNGIKVNPVDTTGAGDTFTGFFVSELMSEKSVNEALTTAIYASALECTRKGASPSIPTVTEVNEFRVLK